MAGLRVPAFECGVSFPEAVITDSAAGTRIISARKANSREKQFHEQHNLKRRDMSIRHPESRPVHFD